MITINISRFVNVRFVTNVIANLVDVTGAFAKAAGSKPAPKPGPWCAMHSDSYRDSGCPSQEPSERGSRQMSGTPGLRLRQMVHLAITRLAATATASTVPSGTPTLLRFSAA